MCDMIWWYRGWNHDEVWFEVVVRTGPVVVSVALAVLGLFLFSLPIPTNSQQGTRMGEIYTPDGTLRRVRVPILMYHYVSPLPPDASDIRVDLTLDPEMFRAHMQYLRDQGYEPISFDRLYGALVSGAELPPRPIVLTFDDGYVDHYDYVFPILREFGFTGTFFVITGTADNNEPAHLSWSQITEMAAAGMSMQSHTRDHLDLRNRDRDFLIYQILGSLESLEAHTGQPAQVLCYPAGRYDEQVLDMVRQMPIALAVTTESGATHTTSNLLELSRLRISRDTGVLGLARLLRSNQ